MRRLSFVSLPTTAVAGLFLATHHAGPTALGTYELPFLMGRVGHFPHFNLTSPAKHTASPNGQHLPPMNFQGYVLRLSPQKVQDHPSNFFRFLLGHQVPRARHDL